MEKLETLASIKRLSPLVVRVLGQNPGKFTLQGTNTYLIGSQKPYILIDTAQGLPQYIPILESALKGGSTAEPKVTSTPTLPDVSDIIISHWHHDHIGGLPSVLSLLKKLWDERNNLNKTTPTVAPLTYTPPRLHKFSLPPGDDEEKISPILKALPADSYTPSPNGSPFHDLYDHQILHTANPDPTNLQIIHTPGHTPDSISVHLPSDNALYTADTVLGQGTAVFDDLARYLKSLNKLLDFLEENKVTSSSTIEPGHERYAQLYPGHGSVVANGPELINTYIQHRLERENQIIEVLKTKTGTGRDAFWTTWTIVGKIYAGYPEDLWEAAARGVDLHLRKLEGEGRVRRVGGKGKDTQWELIA